MAGIDGECFNYSVYLNDEVTDEKFKEIKDLVTRFIEEKNAKDIYLGYVDVTKENDRICIYLDIGGVDPQFEDASVQGILATLNKVSGIKKVIINE